MIRFRRAMSYAALVSAGAVSLDVPQAYGDETCNSPYVTKLIKGQEDYVYVWALGVEGLGDGSDKMVTVDVNPRSKNYGKAIQRVSVGSRGVPAGTSAPSMEAMSKPGIPSSEIVGMSGSAGVRLPSALARMRTFPALAYCAIAV